MPEFDRFAPAARLSQRVAVVSSVVLVHGLGLWVLATGLSRPAPSTLVAPTIPTPVVAELLAPPAPPPRPQSVTPANVVPRAAAIPLAKVAPTPPRPKPTPLAVATAAPAPALTVPAPEPIGPSPATPAPSAPPISPVPVVPAPSTPSPRLELPSSNAAYLQNPAPAYPVASKRMGEQGKVVLRVLIGADGLPQKIELQQSSGYDRLDRQAQEAVMRWRFVAGKRNGIAEAMWHLVPINFVLE